MEALILVATVGGPTMFMRIPKSREISRSEAIRQLVQLGLKSK